MLRVFKVCALLAGGLLSPLSAHAQRASACQGGSHPDQMDCVAVSIDYANLVLDRLYQAALAKLPATGPNDIRKQRSQLVKAEDAWRAYANGQCAFVGGQEGGSNSWVSQFASQCLLDETDKRIAFFQHPSSGEQ